MDNIKPLFSFGVITDIQYADVDDGWDFHHIHQRRYRNSLEIVKEAVKDWKKDEISFVVQLGDLIDGLNKKYNQSKQSIDLLQKVFDNIKTYHIIGNHELYNFKKEELNSLLNTQPNNTCYYDFSPHPKWRFIILDSYDLCIMHNDTRQDAFEYLKKHNPNDCTNSNADWSSGLSGLDLRFLPYNGGIKENQLLWLKETLMNATKEQQKVIILSHIPICPGSCDNTTLLWNYDDVLNIIHSFSCVVACLTGHDHQGGFTRDEHGIFHKTFEAVLETPVGSTAYGTIHVYSNKLVIKGSGIIKDDVWIFE